MAEIEINNTKELEEKIAEAVKDNPNKPTEEEIKLAGEEFESTAKAFPTILWEVGKPEKAREYIQYLQHFVRNRLFWTKNGWMGVVKLQEELENIEKTLKEGEAFKLGYQALEFTYFSLVNPGGVGLQTALDFEQEATNYLPLFEDVSLILEEARKQLKNIQFLQDKWSALSQGFYLEVEPSEEVKNPEDELKTELADLPNNPDDEL
jgi:hypothetical protein